MRKSNVLIVLASSSPRRKLILESLGLRFTIRIPNIEENKSNSLTPEKLVLLNAKKKALSVVDPHSNAPELIVGVDTGVWLPGKTHLTKPNSTEEAKTMLRKLSGKTHNVFSGLFIFSKIYGVYKKVIISKVTFKKLSSSMIENYCKSPEPYDKAGGYGVQGLGSLFIKKIEGSYTNVMGLPIEAFLIGIEKLTKIPLWKWF